MVWKTIWSLFCLALSTGGTCMPFHRSESKRRIHSCHYPSKGTPNCFVNLFWSCSSQSIRDVWTFYPSEYKTSLEDFGFILESQQRVSANRSIPALLFFHLVKYGATFACRPISLWPKLGRVCVNVLLCIEIAGVVVFNSIFDAFRLLGLVKFDDTFDGFSNFMKVSTLRSLCNSLQAIIYINVEKASKFCFVHQLGNPQGPGGWGGLLDIIIYPSPSQSCPIWQLWENGVISVDFCDFQVPLKAENVASFLQANNDLRVLREAHLWETLINNI